MPQLDQKFVVAVVQTLSNTPVLCDIAVNAFFPEVGEGMQAWHRLQIQASIGDAYDKYRSYFPTAPERQPEDRDPDLLFREMLKHILAKAFNVEYRSEKKLVIAS